MTMKIEITIAGHAGSGKSIIAHKIAAALRECCAEVAVFDEHKPVPNDANYENLVVKLNTSVEIMTESV